MHVFGLHRRHALWMRGVARAHVPASTPAICTRGVPDAAYQRVFARRGAAASGAAFRAAVARGGGDQGVLVVVDGAAECHAGAARE